ncbi:MAG: glycosyltransferase [Chloroflexi bacterium]|nr:glycosyltransferase [Chloroflexota bacterium]
MKVVLVTPGFPAPPTSGGSQRAFHLLRLLGRRHQVHLFSLVGASPAPDALAQVQPFCSGVTLARVPGRSVLHRLHDLISTAQPDLAQRFAAPEARALLARLLGAGACDVVQVEGLEASADLLAAWEALPPPRPALVLDAFNAEYLLQRRAFLVDLGRPDRWPVAAYSLVQWHRLRRYEQDICRRAAAVLAVSEADRQALLALVGAQGRSEGKDCRGERRAWATPGRPGLQAGIQQCTDDRPLAPGGKVALVPHGVDTARYRPPSEPVPGHAPELLFTGTMDYRPNVDAITWFCTHVLPRVRERVPDVRLTIVGRDPTAAVRALAGPSVTVTGAVTDDLPYFQRASAFVLPMRYGGGVRLKLLQALACGLPVVSTPLGTDGVAACHGEHLLLAERPEEFAQAVVRVLADPALAARLGRSGRALVAERYTWEAAASLVEDVYEELRCAGRPQRSDP